MSPKSEMLRCSYCNEMTMHVSNHPNNILHLLLTVFTGSVWFPIWMIILAVQKNPQCTKCGTTGSKATGSKVFARIMIFVALAFVCLVAYCTVTLVSGIGA